MVANAEALLGNPREFLKPAIQIYELASMSHIQPAIVHELGLHLARIHCAGFIDLPDDYKADLGYMLPEGSIPRIEYRGSRTWLRHSSSCVIFADFVWML